MLDRVAREYGPPSPDFTFLSDPGHRVIDRYGLLNEADRRGIPHPTVFVIDRAGVVRWKSIEVNYKIRPTNAMILAALADVLRDSGKQR
jgi:peroxiredoxin